MAAEKRCAHELGDITGYHILVKSADPLEKAPRLAIVGNCAKCGDALYGKYVAGTHLPELIALIEQWRKEKCIDIIGRSLIL